MPPIVLPVRALCPAGLPRRGVRSLSVTAKTIALPDRAEMMRFLIMFFMRNLIIRLRKIRAMVGTSHLRGGDCMDMEHELMDIQSRLGRIEGALDELRKRPLQTSTAISAIASIGAAVFAWLRIAARRN